MKKLNLLSSSIVVIGCLILVIFPFISLAESAQECSLRSSFSADKAKFASIVELTVQYNHRGIKIPYQKPEIGGLEGFTVINKKYSPGALKIRLLVDRLYSFHIPEILLYYNDKSGNVRCLRMPGPTLRVVSLTAANVKETDLKPIREIVPYPFGARKKLIGIALLLCLSLFLTLLFFGKKRGGKSLSPGNSEKDYLSKVKAALLELKEELLCERGKEKLFYFELSLLIREYLEATLGISTKNLTTRELENLIPREGARYLLINILRTGDNVRFGFEVPEQAEKERQVNFFLLLLEKDNSQAL